MSEPQTHWQAWALGWNRAMLILDGSRWWWVLVGFNIGIITAAIMADTVGFPL